MLPTFGEGAGPGLKLEVMLMLLECAAEDDELVLEGDPGYGTRPGVEIEDESGTIDVVDAVEDTDGAAELLLSALDDPTV